MNTPLLSLTILLGLGLFSFACSAPSGEGALGASEDAIQTSPADTPLPETVSLSCDASALGHVEITLLGGTRTSSFDVSFESVQIKRGSGKIETLAIDGHDVRASYSIPILEAERSKGSRVSVAAPAGGISDWDDVCYAKAPSPGFSIGLFAPSGNVDPQWSPNGPTASLTLRNPRVEAELQSGIGWPTFGPDMLDGKQRCEGAIAGYRGPSSADMNDLRCVITTTGVAASP